MESRRTACILCRGIKLKCVNDDDMTTPCQRCTRLNLPCTYSKKRRRNVKAGLLKIAPAPSPRTPAQPASQPVASSSRSAMSTPVDASQSASQPAASSSRSAMSTPVDPSPEQGPLSLPQRPSPHGPHHSHGSHGPHGPHGPHAPHQPHLAHLAHPPLPPPMAPHRPQQPPPPQQLQAAVPETLAKGGTSTTSAQAQYNPAWNLHPPPSAVPAPHIGDPSAPPLVMNGPNPSPPVPQVLIETTPSLAMPNASNHVERPPHAPTSAVRLMPSGPSVSSEPGTTPELTAEVPFTGLNRWRERAGSDNPHQRFLDDPIAMGYLDEHEARRLVEMFHQYLNPMIALLDAELHTSEYLRERSSILFTAVLAVTANFFQREAHQRLLGHVRQLLNVVIDKGSCNKAIVQAILILVYWKHPTDQSAWIKIGIATRLGYQLGWYITDKGDTEQPRDVTELREKLDAERTWFCLAAFDRVYSGVYNLPPTVRTNEIGDMEQWVHEHRHLDIDNDLRLCCSLETIVFMDGVRAWREESKTMGKMHAHAQMDRLFENALRIYHKWCTKDQGLPRLLSEKQRAFVKLFMCQVLFGLRFAQLDVVPLSQLDGLLAECLDRAVMYVEQFRIVADEGTWVFQQDIASAKIASFCAITQELYWRLANPQRRVAIGLIMGVQEICASVAGNQPDSPSAFVARFAERLLGSISTASRQPRAETLDPAPHITDLPRPTAPPPPAPVDDLVLNDLSAFLDVEQQSDPFVTFDQSYWNAMLSISNIPLNLNDLVQL